MIQAYVSLSSSQIIIHQMAFSSSSLLIFIFVGDSDISRWPSPEYPFIRNQALLTQNHYPEPLIYNYGKSGALLHDVPKQIDRAIAKLKVLVRTIPDPNADNQPQEQHRVYFIATAGENDLSSGFSVDVVMDSYHKVLDSIFFVKSNKNNTRTNIMPTNMKPSLFFFGPKLEPWLNENGNQDSRKAYYQLSDRMEIASTTTPTINGIHHNHNKGRENVTFIDSLISFCGPSADQQGAVLSGKAQAQSEYFHEDGLHLSDKGYRLWKHELELLISQHLYQDRRIDELDVSLGTKVELD